MGLNSLLENECRYFPKQPFHVDRQESLHFHLQILRGSSGEIAFHLRQYDAVTVSTNSGQRLLGLQEACTILTGQSRRSHCIMLILHHAISLTGQHLYTAVLSPWLLNQNLAKVTHGQKQRRPALKQAAVALSEGPPSVKVYTQIVHLNLKKASALSSKP